MIVIGCRSRHGFMLVRSKIGGKEQTTKLPNTSANAILQRRLLVAFESKKNVIVAAKSKTTNDLLLLDDFYTEEAELREAVNKIGSRGWVVYYNVSSQKSKTAIKP